MILNQNQSNQFSQASLPSLDGAMAVKPGTVTSTNPQFGWQNYVERYDVEGIDDGQDVEANIVPSISHGHSYDVQTNIDAAQSGQEPSLSQYMAEHPGASYEEIMNYMSQHSDEWAEKYLDYLVEKGELNAANAYTAQREDTAYQRLVNDLRAAGLNPALLYGSTASTSASGSQGYVKMLEGANSRSVGNYSKLQKLLLGLMSYQLKLGISTANTALKGVGQMLNWKTDLLKAILSIFG